MRHYRTHGRIMRVFKCCGCGFITRASKRADRKTKRGHVKHIYCAFCKRVMPFIQISN